LSEAGDNCIVIGESRREVIRSYWVCDHGLQAVEGCKRLGRPNRRRDEMPTTNCLFHYKAPGATGRANYE
jgi:hypothetical protein